ncbi:hypothetical protein Tco_1154041 [Tanacetum coccineum]
MIMCMHNETHLQAHQTQLQLQGTLIQTQHQVHETRFQMYQAELVALRETDRRRQDQMVETLRVIRDMRQDERHARLSVSTLREGLKRGRFRLGGLKRWSQSSISVVLLSKIKLSLPPALCLVACY